MCLFIEVLSVIITHRRGARTPPSSFIFTPFLFLTQPSILSFQQFFFPSLLIPAFISHALIASSSPLLPPLLLVLSIQITPPPPSGFPHAFSLSLSLSIRPSILPSLLPPKDQGRDSLTAVRCTFAGRFATEVSSVSLVTNDLCSYRCTSDTSKSSTPHRPSTEGRLTLVC